jgi:Asp-tRNA(Asn)/Glu-tRNA(Gln) amidotransferase A subunit family amidase
MNKAHLSTLSELNALSMTREGCLQIAESFVTQFVNDSKLQNPWVTWRSNPTLLAELLHDNRGKKLSGLLFGAKDVISSEDFTTFMGAPKVWQNSMMGFDARIISQFKMAGAVLAGKTKTSEFAVHESTDVLNPKNPTRTAGTSSAGSAAAVANNTIKLTLGTQTAGSIARPASYCEVLAYKPTFGDFPRTGILKTSDEFDSVGIFGDDLETISTVYNCVKISGQNYRVIERKREEPAFKQLIVLAGFPYDSASGFLVDQLRGIADVICTISGVKQIMSIDSSYLVSVRQIHEDIYRSNLAHYFKEELSSQELSRSMYSFVHGKKLISISEYKKRQDELKSWRRFFTPLLNETLILTLGSNSAAPVTDPTYDTDMNLVVTSLGNPQLIVPGLIREKNGTGVSVSFSMQQGADKLLLETVTKLLKRMETH